MLSRRWVCSLSGAMIVSAIAAIGCNETSGSDNSAPLDYESNPASAKYDFSDVDTTIDDFLEDYPAVNGVTLAIVRGAEGQIYEKGYGELDRDRISLIASTGKVLSAGVILTLVDEGLLDLDRPIAEYLQWGDHHPDVTTRQMLSMMAGFAPLISHPEVCFPTACECEVDTSMQECGRTVFQDETMSVPPGTVFNYGRWQLAGAVAETVSNRSWAELLKQKLAGPCGLLNTGYRNVSTFEYPQDFDGNPANAPETENPRLGGGAYSTVNDYSKVLLMHLREGLCGEVRVLSAAMVQAMQDDLVPDGVSLPFWSPGAANYGMGWWKYEDQPGLLIDSGAFGARSLIHSDEDWGAIMILEADTTDGRELLDRLVSEIRAAVLEADQN